MKHFKRFVVLLLVMVLAMGGVSAQQKNKQSDISRTQQNAGGKKDGKDANAKKGKGGKDAGKKGQKEGGDDADDSKKKKKKKRTEEVVEVVIDSARFACVSIDSMMNHIRELGSSRYEGRLAGTNAYMAAAEYAADMLESYGFGPYEGNWVERFRVETNIIENCKFNSYVDSSSVRIPYVLGKDFVCAGMTGRGYANAPVVFCGYGIDAPAFNEYAHVDAQGKIVLVFSGTPDFLPGSIRQAYSTVKDKAAVAKRHGACALVVIDLGKGYEHEVHGTVFSGGGDHPATFPIVIPHRACGEQFFVGQTLSLQESVDTINALHKPFSFHMRRNFEIDVNATYSPEGVTVNVTALLPGSDDKMRNEILVLGANLDHVGIQGETCLFPGADNNLSGVAAVLEAARLMGTHPDYKPKRSVLVVLFSGGESVQLGSRIFVSNATHKKMEAFLNPVCIGGGDTVLVRGNAQFPLLYGVADSLDRIYTQTMARGYKSYPMGDASPFAYIGIPSLNFVALNGMKRSHKPSDILENINRKAFERNANLFFNVAYELSQGDYQGRTKRSRAFRFDAEESKGKVKFRK
ncbi:MAG: M28 family peptidase [Bacteroidales bacterium]|nr:M28 family peptidase [Bacteroidales bacterium]